MAYPYSLDMLPVGGITDAVQDVETAQLRLNASLEIVDGIRKIPCGLSQTLQQLMANIRFHVISGLSFIDAFLRTGHHYTQQVSEVDTLNDAIALYVQSVAVAKPVWDQWLADAKAQGTPEDQLPAPSSPVVIGQTNAAAAADLTAAKDAVAEWQLGDYITVGVVGLAGLWLLKWLMKPALPPKQE